MNSTSVRPIRVVRSCVSIVIVTLIATLFSGAVAGAGTVATTSARNILGNSPSFTVDQTSGNGSTPVTVRASGSRFAPGGNIRVDLANRATGHTFYGWVNADANGGFSVDVTIPGGELAYCGLACGHSAALDTYAYQYSQPQIWLEGGTITVQSRPTVNAEQTNYSGDLWISATGAGYQPGASVQVNLYNPLLNDTVYAFPIVRSDGTFSATLRITKSRWFAGCIPGVVCTRGFKVLAWQSNGQQVVSPWQFVSFWTQ